MAAVQVVRLRKEFTRRRRPAVVALDDVSFTIGRGECVAVLGQNGSGKSTLVRLLSTLLLPDGGSAHVFGHDVVRDERAVRGVVKLPTGSDDDGAGSGKADFLVDAIVSKEVNRAAEFTAFGGYIVRGRKAFCSLAPALDVFYGTAGLTDGSGLLLFAIGRDAPGLSFVLPRGTRCAIHSVC